MSNYEEKRRFDRVESDFVVSMSVIDKKHPNHTEKKLRSSSVNISASGILFHHKENIKTGEMLFLSFYPVDGQEDFVVEATVVRSKKKDEHEYAIAAHFIRFEKGDEESLGKILKILQK